MTRLGRTVLAAALAVTAAVASAAPKPKKVNSPKPAPDVYGGYSWTHAGEASLHGWSLAGSYPFHTGANRFVLDVSGHYGSFASADSASSR